MRIIFAGTPEFAVPSLQKLIDLGHDVCAVYTQPDRPAGRGNKLHASPIKELALKNNIPVFQPETLKNAEEQQRLKDLNADLMVVVAYGMILPQIVLDTPKYGCINVHGSLLPRWRGAAPIQRAIIEGDEKTGVTIMNIALKLDAGDMLHKEEYTIKPTDTSADVFLELSHLGAIGLEKVIPQLENGTLIPEVQDESQVTYAAKLQKAEAELNWNDSAAVLARKINGLNPWPVAQTLYQGQVLRIWKAIDLNKPCRLPASTVQTTEKHFDVATGQGLLRLLEVQLPNAKRISAEAFLNAHSADGEQLG